jgi:carboxyl-terminal processing protease
LTDNNPLLIKKISRNPLQISVADFLCKLVSFFCPKAKKTFFIKKYVLGRTDTDNPLIVLVGRWTGSVGEGLASGFDGTGIGKIVGTEMEKLAGATKSYSFSNFEYSYQAPYIDVLHISGLPREKFIPKYKVVCNDGIEDEFIKEGIRIINQQK